MEIIALILIGIITLYFLFIIIKGWINEKRYESSEITTYTVKTEEVIPSKENTLIESVNDEIDIIVESTTEIIEVVETPTSKKRNKRVSKKVE
jgi:hypothetical protein